MNELTKEIIGLVKNASPVVWAIYIRQVYTLIAMQLIMTAITFIISIWLFQNYRYARKRRAAAETMEDRNSETWSARRREIEHWDFYLWMSGGGGTLMAFLAGILLVYTAMQWINPEYYAIGLMIEQLK